MNAFIVFVLVGLFALIFILALFLYYDCEESNNIQEYDYDDRVYYDDFGSEGTDFLNEINKQGKVHKKTKKEDRNHE